jgi:hypothetical protein
MAEHEQIISAETWEMIDALLGRTDLVATATAALRRAYPDAPPHMIETAVFHVFRDGVRAALEWVAAAERFLRDPRRGLDYGLTWHVVYHLYNWQQFEALLPIGREGIFEQLQDLRVFLKEGDPEAAQKVLKRLEEMFAGDARPPSIA